MKVRRSREVLAQSSTGRGDTSEDPVLLPPQDEVAAEVVDLEAALQ
jgi:hypothetical protein